jgi:cyanophycinase
VESQLESEGEVMQTRLVNSIGMALLSGLVGCSNVGVAPTLDQPATANPAEQVMDSTTALRARPVGRKLMIIGTQTDVMVGSVTDDAIFIDRMIADVGGKDQLRILVVPGASGIPNWLYAYLGRVLATRGVPASNLQLAKIAAVDDDTTPDVDESTWSNGAYLGSEVAKVARANVVWFAGGDQSRLVSLLIDDQGKDSPFQSAVKAKLALNDLIIAGYSAGAAAMSDPMIGGGTSWGALTLPPDPDPACNTDAICVTRGLGYIPARYSAITDQHFMQRGRFARAVRALSVAERKTLWGVDAYTAFYVDLMREQAEVIGVPKQGSVAIIGRDGAAANHEHFGPSFTGDQYTVSVLSVGDLYNLPSKAHPHGEGLHPNGDDYYEPFSQYYSDMPVFMDAFGKDVLYYNITEYFADGTAPASGARVDALSLMTAESGDAAGFRMRFTADRNSEVAWNEESGYSMFNARLQISTVTAKINGVGP